MPFELVTSLAWQIVRALIERRAGPETPESRELLKQIDAHRSEIGRLEDDIGELEQRRVELRRQARSARPTWWHSNRQVIAVNVVSGLIVSVPIFLLGVVVTLLVSR